MRLFKHILTVCLFSVSSFLSAAQALEYDQKIDIGNGLYKVMTNNRWGIIDKDGNLKLSAEHNEPVFVDGKAVISKFGTNQLVGIMDMGGNITPTPQYFINPDFPLISNDMLVVKETPDGKWGYLNTSTGYPIFVKLKGIKPGKNKAIKALGINGKNIEGNFVFDFAAPFNEGLASVWIERIGWLHIDNKGNQRLINPNGQPSLFRSTVNDGKSVIFDDRGIVLSMETPDNQAGVAMYYNENASPVGYSVKLTPPYSFTNNGFTLYLNDIFQADKLLMPDGDSLIFIERKKPVVTEVDSIATAPEDKNVSIDVIGVSLSRKNVAASSKGTATVTFNITNEGSVTASGIRVYVDVQGSSKVWAGNLEPGATTKISVSVPARFSSPSVTKKAKWTVSINGNEVSGSANVTISRYKPNRR